MAKFKAPHRTTVLPIGIRKELEQLGHLPARKPKKEKPSQKENRKRKQPQLDKAEEEPEPKKAKLKQDEKKTPLQRLLEKQEGKQVAVTGPRSQLEEDEDKEIFWLEAKLGPRRKKQKDAEDDDGLDEILGDLDDLEDSIFGKKQKNYSKLLEDMSDDDSENEYLDEDEDEGEDDMGGSAEELESEQEASDEDLSEEEFSGIASDAKMNADHKTAKTVEGTKPSAETKQMKPTEGPVNTNKYIPPHLRAKLESEETTPATESTPTKPTQNPRVRLLLLPQLNRLAPTNLPPILTAILSIYSSHPRAIVSETFISLLLEILGSRDEIIGMNGCYAALISGLMKEGGARVGELAAGVISAVIETLDANKITAGDGVKDDEWMRSKQDQNLTAFLGELFNFGVVGCGLVYDLIRDFVGSEHFGERETELLVTIVRRCGQQLRQEDPSALKEIIQLVKLKTASLDNELNVRTKFMLETFTNLKNNKLPLSKPNANGSTDPMVGLKKYISGLGKQTSSLRISLADLRASRVRGKWWVVGAAWRGNPLLEVQTEIINPFKQETSSKETEELIEMARKQGMNTDVRKMVFNVIMSSQDYMDACEQLLALGLKDVQQREIARVLLQCCGNEKNYNPYYSLLANHLAKKSHGFGITLQYCLWDFLRQLGENSVGGEGRQNQESEEEKVPSRKRDNIAKLYGWCIGHGSLSLGILKPLPFARLKETTTLFLNTLFIALLISSQSPSPLFLLPATMRKNKEGLEKVILKIIQVNPLVAGFRSFVEGVDSKAVMKSWKTMKGLGDDEEAKERLRKLIKWGKAVIDETLGLGGSIVPV